MSQSALHVVIVGNGITGTTAALTLRAADKKVRITIISDETELFFSRTALMYVYMRQLQFDETVIHRAAFFKKNEIQLKFKTVSSIDYTKKVVHTESQEQIPYDYLLLAPGSKPRHIGIPGEDSPDVQGLYSRGDLERLEAKSAAGISHAVIVGGGLIGVELAEMLHTRRIPFTFLVRDDLYFANVLPREEAGIITNELKDHGIRLMLKTELNAIETDKIGNVTSIITSGNERITCNLIGMTIGVTPRLKLVRNSPITYNSGILTDKFLRTNLPEVFAAGDAAEIELPDGQRKVQQLWYTGRRQGVHAGQNLAQIISGNDLKPYDPGIFFNSAKFFSIEYQTYGLVPASASSTDSILWQDEKKKKLIRIYFEHEGGERIVKGFNVLGIRYRHEVCEHWIREKVPLKKVLSELMKANFDPEFYTQFEKNLRSVAR